MNHRSDRQGGWVGMIALLLALAIVAYLAKDALVKYGMLGGVAPTTRAATPAERARAEAAGGTPRVDPAGTAPSPASAIDRARGLETFMKEESAKRGGDN